MWISENEIVKKTESKRKKENNGNYDVSSNQTKQ